MAMFKAEGARLMPMTTITLPMTTGGKAFLNHPVPVFLMMAATTR